MSSTVASCGHVDGLRDRARDERLDRAHHLDVAHVRDRALADRDVEHRQVLLVEPGRADDRAVLGQVRLDLLDLRLGVAERLQRQRHRAVDDRHLPAADELLELDEREVGLDAGRVAVHQEGDRAGRREHRRLRVAVAVRSPSSTASSHERRAAASSSPSAQACVRRSRRRRRGACASRCCAARGSRRSARTGPSAPATSAERAVGATGHQRRDRRGGRRDPRRSRRACRCSSGRRRGWRSRGRAGGRRAR